MMMTPDVARGVMAVGFTTLVLNWERLDWDSIRADDRCELSQLLKGLNCWWRLLRSVDVSQCSPEVQDMAADMETALMRVYPLVYNRLAMEKLSLAKKPAEPYFIALRAEYDNLVGSGRTLIQALHPALLSHYNAAIA